MNRPARRRHMPRIFTSPPSNIDMNLGADIAEVSETANRSLDTWQYIVLEKASRINTVADEADTVGALLSTWTWSAAEVGLLTGRQNGKSYTAEARELAGLYTLRENIVHTAYNLQAARHSMDRMVETIESAPHLARQVQQIHRGRGTEAIVLRNGAEIRYCARGPASLDAAIDADLLVLDDADHLPEVWTNAAVHGTPFRRPTSTRRQVWYVGTAVIDDNDPYGHVFTSVRNRGLTGCDPNLCWIEYSAPDTRDEAGDLTIDTSSPAVIARANPSERIDINRLIDMRNTLTDQAYEAEILGIGNWPNLDHATV